MTKRKTGFIIGALACVCASAAIGGTMLAASSSGELTLSQVAINEEYAINTKFAVPAATLTLGGETKDATTVLYLPDGSGYTYRETTLSQVGEYTIEYSAYFNGKKYAENVSFDVYNTTYSVDSLTASATYYENYEFEEFDGTKSSLKGVLVELPSGSEFRFNKPIDFSNKTKNDPFIEFAVLPNVMGLADAQYLYFKLTDAHDSTNYVLISYHDMQYPNSGIPDKGAVYGEKIPIYYRDDGVTTYNYTYGLTDSYVKAGAAMQSQSGLNGSVVEVNNNYGTQVRTSFHAATTIDLATGLNTEYFRDAFSSTSIDYAERSVYAYSELLDRNSFVIDMDSPDYFLDFWNGFTAGEAYLSIYFGDYTGTTSARIFVSDIDGNDLSTQKLYDTQGPKLDIQLSESGVLPAIKGIPYPVYGADALDSYDGVCEVKTNVYYNYGSTHRKLYDIKNGRFTPDREGYYTIVYEAKDHSGNVTTEKLVVWADDEAAEMEMSFSALQQSVVVGNYVSLGQVSVDNGIGKVSVVKSVSVNGNEVEIKNDSFLAKAVGTYTVSYTATDELGRTSTGSYAVTATRSDLPVFYDTVTLPRYLIDGKNYNIPDLSAYGYASSDVGTPIASKKYVTDKNGRREVTEDTFTPAVNANGDIVRVEYVATEGTATQPLVYDLPCYIVTTTGGIDMAKYFAPTSGEMTSVAEKDGVKIATSTNDTSFVFINALVCYELDLEWSVDAANNAFNRFDVYLTDSVNEDIQLKFSFQRSGSGSTLMINENRALLYTLKSSFTGVGDGFKLIFNEGANTITTEYDESKELTIDRTLLGEAFSGFPSGKAYLACSFQEVTGASAVKVTTVNGQRVNTTLTDNTRPKIVALGSYATSYPLGSTVTLSEVVAGDVLDPNLQSFTMSVRTPSKKYLTVDGVELKNVAPAVYTFELTEYGKYTVTYTAVDTSGKSRPTSYVLVVEDDVKPTIALDGEVPKTAAVNTEVAIPMATVSDNVDARVTLYVFLENPEGSVSQIIGSIGTDYKFTPTMKGKYTLKYMAFDSTGNLTILNYEIDVR
ncbi:MAG: hypothetical protein IJ514_06185 [Clostridia bacterium]|nr:hypothetical protein [Clostridia bacterium]